MELAYLHSYFLVQRSDGLFVALVFFCDGEQALFLQHHVILLQADEFHLYFGSLLHFCLQSLLHIVDHFFRLMLFLVVPQSPGLRKFIHIFLM